MPILPVDVVVRLTRNLSFQQKNETFRYQSLLKSTKEKWWVPSSSRLCSTCWSFVMAALILTGILPISVKANQNAAHLPDPGCFIEYGREVDRCTITQYSSSSGYIIQNFNGSEGVWYNNVPYANISIDYPTLFRGILRVQNQYGFSRSLHIDLGNYQFKNNLPFTLRLSYLPYNLGELSVHQLRNAYIIADPCHYPESMNECTVLIRNSNLSMKSNKNSIKLKLIHPFTQVLKVELYGRHCDSSCDEMYPSCPTNMTTLQWSDVIYNTHGHDCCNIFTTTKHVHYAHRSGKSEDFYKKCEDLPTDCSVMLAGRNSKEDTGGGCGGKTNLTPCVSTVQWLPHTDHNYHRSTFFYMMLVVLLAVMGILGLINLRGCKGRVKNLSVEAHEHSSEENTELISIQKFETQKIKILLLYPKRDKMFMDAMNSFRKILKVYSKDVWDPLDPEQIEKVAENPAKWLQHVLTIPDLKIVIVETEEAVSWIDNPSVMLDVCNEDLYFSGISFVLNQPELLFNYRQVLVVRFDHFKTHIPRSLTMVPQKRYNMPHQLGLLIMDMTNTYEYAFDHDNSVKDAVNSFYGLTESYQHCLEIPSV